MKYLFLVLLCVGCPNPVTPPTPDASDASMKADALTGDIGVQVCNHLAVIGCPQPVGCAAIFNKNNGKLADLKPVCLLSAHDSVEADACGSVRCN